MKLKLTHTLTLLSLMQLASCSTLISIDAEKSNYDILKESQGDLNFDGINDRVLLTSQVNSNTATIVILISNSEGRVIKKYKNEKLSDGFFELYGELPDVAIKDGTLNISYYGGMCYRTSRELLFKFNKNLDNLYFDAINLSGHNVCNNSTSETETITSNELRETTFEAYIDRI